MSEISLSKAVRANLMSLQSTASMMTKTQERLATGNKVNSALDNPTNFFTASALNSRAADMNSLIDSMGSGISTLEAANNGLTAITTAVTSMQSTLRQARQDKSFQSATFDVTANSTFSVNGGQFDAPKDISLKTSVTGVKAELKSISPTAYLGPVSTTASAQGAGARTLLTSGGGIDQGNTFTVAGVTVTAGADTTDAGLASTIQSTLDLDATTTGKYVVSAGTGDNLGKIIIESKDPKAAAAAVTFATGADAAVKGSTTFNYTAIDSTVTVGGKTIATGATFDEFVANLKAGEKDGGYVVTSDATTKDITLTNADFDDAGTGATAATHEIDLSGAGGTTTAGDKVKIGGVDLAVTAGNTPDQTGTEVASLINADATLSKIYSAVYDATTDKLTLTNLVKGAGNTAVAVDFSGTTLTAPPATSTLVDGTDGVGTAPTVTGIAANQAATKATSVIDLTGLATTTDTVLADTIKIDGVDIAVGPAVDEDAAGALILAGITGDATLNAKYTASYDTVTNKLTLEDKTAGANRTTAAVDLTGVATGTTATTPAVVFTDGKSLVTGGTTATPGTPGASTEAVEAATDKFDVTYGGVTAHVKVGSVMGGTGAAPNAVDKAAWREATVSDVNAQLKNQGINGVEAKFDADGKFSIVAKDAEKESISVSGADAVRLFGSDTTVTGSATVQPYSATGTVDKFVEEINKTYAGKLRASNDKGQLRIENLSTVALDVSFDSDGASPIAPVSSSIAGNDVRKNAAQAFNDLRDQLDKYADDASFSGINLLRGDKLTLTFNESGTSSIDIQAKDSTGATRAISSANLDIDNVESTDLDNDTNIDKLLGKLGVALTTLRSQASSFGSNLSSVENRQDFTKSMINTLQTGAAKLTLADTNEEAANLLALQTRQQLSSSALSMASQQDQAVLRLLQ